MITKRPARKGSKRQEQSAQSSAYPDLQPAIDQLETRIAAATSSTRPILEKWAETLTKLQTEMRHLERIEKYSGALAKLSKTIKD